MMNNLTLFSGNHGERQDKDGSDGFIHSTSALYVSWRCCKYNDVPVLLLLIPLIMTAIYI